MGKFFDKVFKWLKEVLRKASIVQKIALFAILLFIIFSFAFLIRFSTKSLSVPLFGVSINDKNLLDRISQRLDADNISYIITEDNKIYLQDEQTAKKERAIMIREELVPSNVDPWSLFDIDRWTITDFERNVNLRRSITNSLEQHILALDDIDAVNVNLVMPDKSLFAEQQEPVTVSVRITPKPGSDVFKDRKKIKGLMKLIQYAIEGLKLENIAIIDNQGNLLNDFSDWEGVDRIDLAEKERKLQLKYQAALTKRIAEALGKVLSEDRFSISGVNVKLDTSKQIVESKQYAPIELEAQDVKASYNTKKVSDTTVISSQTLSKSYEGQGYSPWGPPGQEGNTPPEYQNLSDITGKFNEKQETKNVALNEKKLTEEKEPARIVGISIGIFVDGIWPYVYDDKGNYIVENGLRKREYKAMSDDEIKKITEVLESSFDYKPERGDSIIVRNLPFDRNDKFRKIDESYFNDQKVKFILLFGSIASVILIIILVLFFMLSKEFERRRRIREEELAKQAHLRRQQALSDNRDLDLDDVVGDIREGDDLRHNAELLARERPEDVAKLIRTWLIKSS